MGKVKMGGIILASGLFFCAGSVLASENIAMTVQLPFADGASYECVQNSDDFPTHGRINKDEMSDKAASTRFDLDFGLPKGSLVTAAAAGKISEIGMDKDGFGKYIMINHDNGYFSFYGHLIENGIIVEKTQEVAAGQPIGFSGNTGLHYPAGPNTGYHLHFGVHSGTGVGDSVRMSVKAKEYNSFGSFIKEQYFATGNVGERDFYCQKDKGMGNKGNRYEAIPLTGLFNQFQCHELDNAQGLLCWQGENGNFGFCDDARNHVRYYITSSGVKSEKVGINSKNVTQMCYPTNTKQVNLYAYLTSVGVGGGSSVDTTKPTLNSFSVSSGSIKKGSSVTISYKVSDSGGSGLKQVELWKGNNKSNLTHIKTDSLSGDGPKSGTFTDNPTSDGTYYYGIHVVDKAGNVGYDNGAASVTVTSPDTTKPTLNSFSVSSGSIKKGSSVTISYKVSDSGGSGLKQVELWKGNSKSNLSQIKTTTLSGNGPSSGTFSDTPTADGTYYYGIHVVDKAGNVGYDNGAASVTVTSPDTTKPTLHSFSVSSGSIKKGASVTISYKVSDSGGSGLKQVELWKGNSKSNLTHIKTDSLSGNGPKSGTFTDTPSADGTYYYGIHVVDKAGNVGYDNGAASVTVTSPDTTKPTLHSFSVSSGSIKKGSSVTISYKVSDSGGSGLKQVELWKGNSKSNLTHIKTDSLSGDGPKSGQFKDTPSSTGTYYYGIHVVDKAGNVGYDNGAAAVKVNK